jgi:tetratricopeptide (TPR) repeat protein
MKPRDSSIPRLGRACVVALFLVLPAAGAVATLESLVAKSRAAMTEKEWQQALLLNEKAISSFGGDDAFRRYGAQFGVIYYRKGLCELKLGLWQDAMASFETCYRDFPNEGTAVGNPYQKMALRKRAESAMGAGRWELAIASFAKFLAERDKVKDAFPQGSFYINLAVCHYKLGQIAEGSENLEIAIRNKRNFPTSDTGIVAGFQSLVSAAITAGDEQALLDFIRKNRSALRIEPYELHEFSPVFMKLAGDAIATGMRRAALELYQFIPSTDVAIDDVRARLRSMGAAKSLKDGAKTLDRATLEADLAAFKADRRGKRATETIKLAAVAFLHEASGNFLGAYAAYLQLETWFSATEQREENLFNLVRVAARVGLAAESRAHAATFMRDFPKSRHLPEALEIVLSSLLDGADSAESVAVAGPLLASLKEGTPAHETCLYLLATADFRSGAYEEAQPLLDQLVEIYPEGTHAEEAEFLRSSNAARQHHWDEAAAMFDAFLAARPDSPWRAAALRERAACDIALGHPQAARERLARVISGFPDEAASGRCHLLLGTIEAAEGGADEAEKWYLKALESATAHDDSALAAETLCALVELSATAPDDAARMNRAVAHADTFWQKFAAASPLRTRMAIAEVRALVAAKRGAEALRRIQQAAGDAGTAFTDKTALLDAYTRAFLANHGAEELAARLEKFPGIDPADKGLQACLKIALIRAFENEAEHAPDQVRREKAAAKVRTLYQQLKTDFTPADLDTPALIRLADHLRLNTSAPREALALYAEALRREDPRWKSAALLGRADILAGSTDPAETALGIAGFEQLAHSSAEPVEKAYAVFRRVETSMAQGDFSKASATATAFLASDPNKSSNFAPKIALLLARSAQELGRDAEAITSYQRLWSAPTQTLEISAPAMLAWMRLLWQRDRGNDRQTAYDQSQSYLAQTRAATAAMNEQDLAPWHAIEQEVKTFATSPGIDPNSGSKP